MDITDEYNSRISTAAKTISIAIVVSTLISVTLEICTLIGARLATPFNLSDWSLFRISVFWIITFLIIVFIKYGNKHGGLRTFKQVLENTNRTETKHVIQSVSISLAVFISLFCLSCIPFTLAQQTWDVRYGYIIGGVLSTGYLVFSCRHQIAKRIEYGFLILALCFGTICCLCMPVIAEVSYDGQKHFRNAQAVSYIEEAEYSEADLIMTNAYAVEMLDLFKSGDLAALWNPRLDNLSNSRANSKLDAVGNKNIIQMEGTNHSEGSSWISFRSFGYIPNAIGLWIGRLFHLSASAVYFLGREASLIFYSLVFFLAIKCLKCGKMIVAAIGLLPAPLLMTCNYSYDPWCFALLSYSFAKYAGCLQRSSECITTYDMVCILGSFILGAFVKAVLFPLALVFLLAPRSLFASNKKYREYKLGVIASTVLVMASFAVPYLASLISSQPAAAHLDSGSATSVSTLSQQDPYNSQVEFILQNPLAYFYIFFSFTVSFFSPSVITDPSNMLTGSPYLNYDYSSMGWFFLAEGVLLLTVSLLDRAQSKDSLYSGIKMKVAVAIGAVSAYFLIVTALYVDFTPIALPEIHGVQYRYLLPLFVPVFLFGLNVRSLYRTSLHRDTLTMLFCSFEFLLLTIMLFALFLLAF